LIVYLIALSRIHLGFNEILQNTSDTAYKTYSTQQVAGYLHAFRFADLYALSRLRTYNTLEPHKNFNPTKLLNSLGWREFFGFVAIF